MISIFLSSFDRHHWYNNFYSSFLFWMLQGKNKVKAVKLSTNKASNFFHFNFHGFSKASSKNSFTGKWRKFSQQWTFFFVLVILSIHKNWEDFQALNGVCLQVRSQKGYQNSCCYFFGISFYFQIDLIEKLLKLNSQSLNPNPFFSIIPSEE